MLSKESERDKLIIAIEGPDYTGKSSIASQLLEKIKSKTDLKSNIYKRPGGTVECDTIREKLATSIIDSDTRQIISLAEEILFTHTATFLSDITILDRYNPISGQVYGKIQFAKYWRYIIECGMVRTPHLVIFIDSPTDKIIERINLRDKKDVMDEYFIQNVDLIINKYNELKQDLWFNSYFKHTTVTNDDCIESSVESIYNIVMKYGAFNA